MQARYATGTEDSPAGLFTRSTRVLILILPVAILLGVAFQLTGQPQLVLLAGAAVVLLGCVILLITSRLGREPAGPGIILLYVIGLAWVVLATPNREDWKIHLAEAYLLVVPLIFFARQCLRDSGASSLRRARQLASGLRGRRSWPHDLLSCRTLPEVKALREALHVDASPALELLTHAKPQVRIAALAALEYRPGWRPGQPQVVLEVARRASEPEVRAVAVNALANVDDRVVVESLGELLRDGSALVRQTVTEALFWNNDQRWHWIRDPVRRALADPSCQDDGPLRVSGNQLGKEVVTDLHAWTYEKGVIGIRAALTLGRFYGHQLAGGATPELLEKLRGLLTSPQTPHMLRLELARLMKQYRELETNDLLKLLQPTMPAPVRLIAVEALLTLGQRPEAISALYDLARLPNREIALSTADVVQRCLGVDLGLPRDQDPPPVHSRTAAEVARRVLAWAMQGEGTEAATAPNEADSYRASTSSNSRVDLG
ncbi:MAG: HEAT repeat domain-containing protein [Gemmataceae bacterium]